MAVAAGLAQARTMRPEIPSVSPICVQGPKHLGHFELLSQKQSGTNTWDVGIISGSINCYAQHKFQDRFSH